MKSDQTVPLADFSGKKFCNALTPGKGALYRLRHLIICKPGRKRIYGEHLAHVLIKFIPAVKLRLLQHNISVHPPHFAPEQISRSHMELACQKWHIKPRYLHGAGPILQASPDYFHTRRILYDWLPAENPFHRHLFPLFELRYRYDIVKFIVVPRVVLK